MLLQEGTVSKRYVVAVTGASGTILAVRLLRFLTEAGYAIELVVSDAALETASHELARSCVHAQALLEDIAKKERITLYGNDKMGAAIASGSFSTDGMVVLPCSMATLAAIAVGLGDTLIRRAADVTLKERRPLILVPRETPFNTLHLENLLKLSRLGAVILPPIPAWYTKPTTLEAVENFVVGKVCDALKIPHQLYTRWGSS